MKKNVKKGRIGKPEISILISALNEEEVVKPLLLKVLKAINKSRINAEILFMDDHSTDNTGVIAEEISKKYARTRVIHRKGTAGDKKGGVGNSIREGFKNAHGNYILYMDCDSHNPKYIPEFFKHRGDADIIIGSRFVKGGSAEMPFARWIATGSFNFLLRTLFSWKIKDFTSGYKLYSKKMLDNLRLKSEGFGIHAEVPLKALAEGCKIKEIPIHYDKSYKKSTLNYKREFLSYIGPVIAVFKNKFSGKD